MIPPPASTPTESPAGGHSARPGEYRAVYELVFCVFLGVLGFLFRHQAGLVYPQLLYTFAAFLAFNLLFNRFLKRITSSEWPSHAAVFVNGLLITQAVRYSGGPDSYLWVMYLLPLFTACLLFDRARVALSTAYILSLLAWVFREGTPAWEPADWLQLSSRAGLLVLSVATTARLAFSERAAKDAAERQRRRWEDTLRGRGDAGDAPAGRRPSETLLGQSVHDLNSALAVILGSAQLMTMSRAAAGARDDVERIQTSVRVGKMILQNLALTGTASWPLAPRPLREAVGEAVEQCAAEFAERGVRIALRWTAAEDAVKLSPPLMRQAIVNLLLYAAPAGEIVVEGRPAAEGVEVVVTGAVSPEPERPEDLFDPFRTVLGRGRGFGVALHMSREIARRHGGDVTVVRGEEGCRSFVVRLPKASPAGDAGEAFVAGFRVS